MKKLFTFLATLLISVFLVLPFTTPVVAQTSPTKVTITPVTFNLSANAGDSLKEVIKIRNDATFSQDIIISAENFVAVGEEGEVGLTEENTTYSLASWIVFDKTKYTLKSGDEIQVPFSIRVPFNAEPGGHYASVYAQINPSSVSGSSGSSVGQKIGSLVLLRVAGDVKEQASVESFSVEKIAQGKPVVFDIRVKNEGSVHIRPQGFVAVTDIFGKKVADVKVNEANVFPGAVRHLSAEWKKPPFIGRYTANLLMYYGQNNQQLTATTTFWIIPWRALAIWGGVALLVILILVLGRKRISRSVKALATGK